MIAVFLCLLVAGTERVFGPGDYLLRAPSKRVRGRCFTFAASREGDNNAQRCAACEAGCKIKVINS